MGIEENDEPYIERTEGSRSLFVIIKILYPQLGLIPNTHAEYTCMIVHTGFYCVINVSIVSHNYFLQWFTEYNYCLHIHDNM